VELKRVGAEYRGRCPFHNDRTPSFYVSPTKGVYHCFGCGASGDVIRFIQQIEGVSFMEALRILAERVGVNLDEELKALGGGASRVERSPARVLKRAVTMAAMYYSAVLKKSGDSTMILSYLKERGLTKSDIERWRIGYAHPGMPLSSYLKKKGIDPAPFVQSGVLLESGADRMRGRIVIPIPDGRGELVSLAGRLWRGDGPKYMNGPDTPIFKKKRLMFGMHVARPYVRELPPGERRFVVVEGYFDVIILQKYGFMETVAPMGTALSDEHARMLGSLADRVYLVFDADEAGIKATIKSGFKLFETGADAYVVILPEGTDPDEFVISEGADAFEEVLRGAKSFADFMADYLTRGIVPGSPMAVSTVSRRVEPLMDTLNTLTKPLWEEILRRAGRRVGFPLMGVLDRVGRRQGVKNVSSGVKVKGIGVYEEKLMVILKCSPWMWFKVKPQIRQRFAPMDATLQRLVNLIEEYFETYGDDWGHWDAFLQVRMSDDGDIQRIYQLDCSRQTEVPRDVLVKAFVCTLLRWFDMYIGYMMKSETDPEKIHEYINEQKAIAGLLEEYGCA
jgi:DNA primase